MKINILLPYKEKFDVNKASSVSITVKNNLLHTEFLSHIKIYGQNVENPLFKNNFEGIKYSIFSVKSRNLFLAHKMLKMISKESSEKQLIEIHNRPYLIEQIAKKSNFPITLFLHNDPQTMKGAKSVKDRQNILEKANQAFSGGEKAEDFSKKINDAINSVADSQNKASEITKDYELGKETDLTKVIMQQQISSIAFQMTLNVRNKVLSSYKDIMNMPV